MLFCFFVFSISIFNLKQLYVFPGKYCLVDSGYPNEYGFLGPYSFQRYLLQEFRRRGQPQTREEIFNRMHSSLRCVINEHLEFGKKDGEFYRICHPLITRHKFKLLSHPWQFIITLEELQCKMWHLWCSIAILILCPMIF